MSKSLPERPNLEHLRDQAKALLSQYRAGSPDARVRLEHGLPGPLPAEVALHDAQSVIAREYGFASWPKLVNRVEAIRAKTGITAEVEYRFLEACHSDMENTVRKLIELYPELPRYSPACALVSAELDIVRQVDPTQRLGQLGHLPIEYVAYSRIHRAFPERYAQQEACLRDLLDRGADPNTRHTFQDTGYEIPVLYGASAESGHLGMTRLLLERGANPNDGESIYHSAERGRLEILELFPELGARFGPDDGHLGFLVWYRDSDPGADAKIAGAKWLLEHGADPNVQRQESQDTPLHSACRYSKREGLLQMLLDHGANPALQNGDGLTPYQVAVSVGNRVAVDLLKSRPGAPAATPEQWFLYVCATDDEAAIRSALAKDPELPTRLKKQAGELAKQFAEEGNVEGLRGLASAGFSLAGDEENTPLHFAALRGHAPAAEFLIESGVPLDVKDSEYNASPLGWACHGSLFFASPEAHQAAVARLLLAAGSSRDDARERLEWQDMPEEIAQAIQEGISESPTIR